MSRRRVLFGATLAVLTLATLSLPTLSAQAAQSDTHQDAVQYVRALYQRAAAGRVSTLPKKELVGLLSGDLRRLWQVQVQAQPQPPQTDGEFVRAVMFGPKVQRAGDFALGDVVDIPGLPQERMVAVEFTAAKEPHQVFVHLAPVDKGGWVIVNFIYDSGEDFRRTSERRHEHAGG